MLLLLFHTLRLMLRLSPGRGAGQRHHLILLLPLIGLAVFWLLPPSSAIPAYLAILLASAGMYWAILRAVKRTPTTGAMGLKGTSGRVVSRLKPSEASQYLVEADGELWSANSADTLQPGDEVRIVDVKGIRLEVARGPGGTSSGRPKDV
jgi:membrane protein implicated in regulation of membrane protease activity